MNRLSRTHATPPTRLGLDLFCYRLHVYSIGLIAKSLASMATALVLAGLILLGAVPVAGKEPMVKYKDPMVRLYTDIGPEQANKVLAEIRFFNKYIDGFFKSFRISKKKSNPIRCRLYNATDEFNDAVRKRNLPFKAGAYFSENDNCIIAPWHGGNPIAFAKLRHECAHQIISSYFNNTPPWLDEGLACYFEGVEFDRHKDVISCCSRFSNFSAMQSLIGRERLLDWEHLFGLERRSVWDDEVRRKVFNVNYFYTQSWGVIFFYLHSGDKNNRSRFGQFLKGMNTGRERTKFLAQDLAKKHEAFEAFYVEDHRRISKLFENATQLYDQENYAECLAMLNMILSDDPLHFASIRLSADATWEIEDYVKSIEYWRKLEAREPKEVLFKWKICRCLVETGTWQKDTVKLEEALKKGKFAVRLSKHKNPHCLAAQAMAHFALGEVREALGAIRNAIRFRCNMSDAYKRLEKKYSQALLRRNGDAKHAEKRPQ